MFCRKKKPIRVKPKLREWVIEGDSVEEVMKLFDIWNKRKTQHARYMMWKRAAELVPEILDSKYDIDIFCCGLIVKLKEIERERDIL